MIETDDDIVELLMIPRIGRKKARALYAAGYESIGDVANADVKDLAKERLPSGRHADRIEAVAEGVVFGSLKQVLETRTSRLLVLRPQFTKKKRLP